MKKNEGLLIGLLIIIIAIIAIIFGTRKIDYHVDEVWTFGLSNHVGGIDPDIEYGKVYSGMGFYEDFMEVSSGHRFDYANLWHNQANDVHPPLYYVFVHTICSLFPDSYSKWYGIAVNLFWMSLIIVLLYKLAKKLTGSVTQAAGLVLAYGTTTAFIDTVLFIRMYEQYTFFAIAIAYLLRDYWDKKLDKRFYALFSFIAVFGMLTHYYFLIYMFFVCVTYALHLISEKRFTELRNCVITAACDGAVYLIIWPYIIKHMFSSYRGRQAIQSASSLSGLANGIFGMFREISVEAFAGAMVLFILLILILAVKRYRTSKFKFSYNVALFVSAVLYTCVVGKIAPFIDYRYVSPVTFIYSMIVFMAVVEAVSSFKMKVKPELIAVIILCALNIAGMASAGFTVPKDYYSDEKLMDFEEVKGKDCEVYIDAEWESLVFFQKLQYANSYVFVKVDNIDELSFEQMENNGKIRLVYK